jgi:hypothetical protein
MINFQVSELQVINKRLKIQYEKLSSKLRIFCFQAKFLCMKFPYSSCEGSLYLIKSSECFLRVKFTNFACAIMHCWCSLYEYGHR